MRLCLLLFGAAAAMAARLGTVEGTVTNSVTGGPVRHALVTLRSAAQYAGYQALTDSGGRFRFLDVKAGTYVIGATAQGYVADIADAALDTPPDKAIAVSDAQSIKDAAVKLVPLSAISGRVVDENDQPVIGAAVEALQYRYSRWGHEIRAEQSAVTNDRGEYRMYDLAPGRWYLQLSKYVGIPPVTGRIHSSVVEEGYAAALFGEVVTLVPGADLRGMDFRLRRIRVFHLRGTTAAGADVWLYRCADDRQAFTAAKAGSDGRFDFKGLAPGCYTLYTDTAGPPKLGSQPREVTIGDSDVNDVDLRLEPTITISGTVLVEDGPLDKLQYAAVQLDPATRYASQATALIAPDGTFTISNLTPSRYYVSIARARGMYLKSVRLGSVDLSGDAVLDATAGGALTLVLGGDGGVLTGTVRAALSWLPLRVTLAPESGRVDLLRTFEPDDSGFRVEGLAPGNYQVLAWQSGDETLLESAEFRALFASKAARVAVTPHAKTSVDLQTITAAEIAEARGRLK